MQIDREMLVKRAINVKTLHILKHFPQRKQIRSEIFIYFHFDIQIFSHPTFSLHTKNFRLKFSTSFFSFFFRENLSGG